MVESNGKEKRQQTINLYSNPWVFETMRSEIEKHRGRKFFEEILNQRVEHKSRKI